MKPLHHMRAVLLLAGMTPGLAAWAQPRPAADYPNRPIRVIVAQAAGSGVDLLTRIVARKLGDAYGQQVIVDNRPGANGIIGLEGAAKSKPDGYTFAMGWPGSIILNLYAAFIKAEAAKWSRVIKATGLTHTQ